MVMTWGDRVDIQFFAVQRSSVRLEHHHRRKKLERRSGRASPSGPNSSETERTRSHRTHWRKRAVGETHTAQRTKQIAADDNRQMKSMRTAQPAVFVAERGALMSR
eukprot:2005057-Rhodomonas_salina.3